MHQDEKLNIEWKPIATAPFEHDVEVAVVNDDGIHALVFPCRRVRDGWVDAETNEPIEDLEPTHWREWPRST